MKIKRFLKILIIVILIIISVLFLQSFCLRPLDSSDMQVKGFYAEEPDSIDVVLLGASDIYSDFSPMQAYEEYGFTSYDFAVAQNSAGFWKFQYDEAIRTQHPSLIVIEVNGALYTDPNQVDAEDNIRFFTNNMPNCKEKLEFVSKYQEGKNIVSYFFPFLKYHGNIKTLPEMAKVCRDNFGFIRNKGLLMHGQRTRVGHVKEQELKGERGVDDFLPMEENHEKALIDFLEYIKDKPTPVLFIRTPHIFTEETGMTYEFYLRTHRVFDIIDDYGYNYVNYDDKDPKEYGLDIWDDFDDVDHCNLYGQKKFTRMLSEYILDNYPDIKKDKTGSALNSWNRGAYVYDVFCKKALEYMEGETDVAVSLLFKYESGDLLKYIGVW